MKTEEQIHDRMSLSFSLAFLSTFLIEFTFDIFGTSLTYIWRIYSKNVDILNPNILYWSIAKVSSEDVGLKVWLWRRSVKKQK